MSSELLKKQLKESEIFQSAIYNKDTDTYLVKKSNTIILHQYKSYIVELNDNLVKDKGDDVTQFNWNKGQYPTARYYKIDIEKIVGKMIYCTGIGYDYENKSNIPNCFWHGYLPKDKIKVIQEL